MAIMKGDSGEKRRERMRGKICENNSVKTKKKKW